MVKPSFKPITMKEVNEKKSTNGYNVVSTFTGAGGSCIGLKLAGFNILYAVEFIPEAQRTYALNHPDTYLDKRDIREIKSEDILNKINLDKTELDLLEGSPPCASFTQIGKGSELWGCVKKYSDTEQQVDDLFFEFTRLVDGIRPKMVLCENVPALARGMNKGILKLIVKEFDKIGYNVRMKILDSSRLDVPQQRKRLILIGHNKDYDIDIHFPRPNNYIYTVDEVFDDFENNVPSEEYNVLKEDAELLQARFDYCREHHLNTFADASKIIHGKNASFAYRLAFKEKPSPTLISKTPIYHGYQNRSLSIDEAKILHTFPIDFELTGSFNKKWERIGRSVPPRMYEHVGNCIKKSLDDYYGKEG